MALFDFFRRTDISDRQEAAVMKTLQSIRSQRRNRFRILACIDGSEEAMITVRFAARLAVSNNCDIIVLYVRQIDMGLHSGGLQVRLARQNMIDAGFELPGVSHLKKSLSVLKEEGIDVSGWKHEGAHQESWGDAAGDTKVEYTSPEGRSVVLKLKTAPDEAGGILDQYELGPYNLMILGQPSHWRSEFRSFFGAGVTQTVTTMAPCSVLVARNSLDRRGFFICTDGSSRSLQAVRRSAVLATMMGEPVTLFSAAPDAEALPAAEEAVSNAKALLKAMKIEVADIKTAVGDVIEEIVERGSLYRMIVVTDEGRTRIERLLKGSRATEVVRLARTSVLDVR
ncbi:MAG: universal stress protein [Rhizobiales bacterium]|nr:universal stress protein [Hyphomicrobiales bacterium]